MSSSSQGFPGGSVGKEYTCNAGDIRGMGSILGSGRPLEKEMIIHFSTLAWRIPWTEQPGGLQYTDHKESDTTEVTQHVFFRTFQVDCGKESTCQCMRHRRSRFSPWVWKIPWRRAWQPTPEFLPGDSHGQRSLVGYSP